MLQWFMARLEVENLPDIIYHSKNCCLNTKTAAQYGHLEMLKWLVENGFKFTVDAFTAAAKEGHLECVVYLRERGCKMTPTVSKVSVNLRPYARAPMGHRKRLQVGPAVDPGSA